MSTSKKLVFFGNERLVSGLNSTEAPVLNRLIADGYDIKAIVVNHSDGKSRSARPLEVAQVAGLHNIPVLSPQNPIDIIDELKALQPDAAVLVAYGRIVPQQVIDVFGEPGIINLHPSLLPRHRGPTPIESTILAGDHQAGVSIMRLSVGMDEGPVYSRSSFELDGTENKFDLCEMLSSEGAELISRILPDILSGAKTPKPQKNSDVSYTSLLTKIDGLLQPASETATQCERKIRAYLNYPKTRITLPQTTVIVTAGRVANHLDDGALVITCADDTYLEITELIGPSGKKMSGEAFLRGYAA